VSGSLPARARYVPYREVGDRPNIIVDGAPLDSTVLTLSHWPNNRTHPSLRRDTSTATVFAYLDAPELHRDVPVVSNNHFDEDGLFSMFGIVDPATALEHRDLLTGAALAGDFGVGEDADALRLCFVIEAFCDAEESPLDAATFDGCERRRVAALYRAMLERVATLAGDVGAWESLWRRPFEHFEHSARLVANGTVAIEEHPDLDLAVVTIPADLPQRPVRRYLEGERAAVHPFAIHNATACNRLLRITGRRYELQYRYESWVQLASRRPALRVALDSLVAELNATERAAGEWRSESVDGVAPRLYLEGVEQSSLGPQAFVDLVRRHLASAPVAWDPYDWDSAA
jgi:hypothetical protein